MAKFLVLDPQVVATQALQKISMYPSSSGAILWFTEACLELREDVDEDDLEDVGALLGPAVASAPDAAYFNDQNGIAEGRLGAVYDALYLYAGEPTCQFLGEDRDSGFGEDNTDFERVAKKGR